GVYPACILLSLLNVPVPYLRVRFSNRNDIAIHYIEEYTLETRVGRVLYERTFDGSMPPNFTTQVQLGTRHQWLRDFNYRFGFFNLTFGLYIKNDGSYTKLVFNGFVFGCGAMIFNPSGEKIE
ncbi:MAG: hypothetical protein R6V50_05095, partial [Thermoplasmatota archaeon]